MRLFLTPECFQIRTVPSVSTMRNETIHLARVSVSVEGLERGTAKQVVLHMNTQICVESRNRDVEKQGGTLNKKKSGHNVFIGIPSF